MSAPMLGGPQPPQSARSILENILYAEAKLQPDELHFRLDAYAHELAEKQRKWAVEDDSGASRADGYGSYGNVLNAADLIDPEVST